jgi:hypothetical protein
MTPSASLWNIRGNLVFYTRLGFSWADHVRTYLIQQRTGAPYVHGEVAMGVSVCQEPLCFSQGLAWLEEQVGSPYGAWDALKQLGNLLFPHHPFACPSHAPHCSQLVLGYLTQMGISLTHLFPSPPPCSPNDLPSGSACYRHDIAFPFSENGWETHLMLLDKMYPI